MTKKNIFGRKQGNGKDESECLYVFFFVMFWVHSQYPVKNFYTANVLALLQYNTIQNLFN